jgi:acyl-CoA-binding protein
MTTNDDEDGLASVLGDDDEFQEAALFVQNNIPLFSRDDLLYLYARFKQVTVGDINIPRPGYFSFEGKAKWDVWNALKSVSKSQASKEYIERVTDIKQRNKIENQKSTKTGPSVSRLLVQNDEQISNSNETTIYEFCQDGNEERVEQMLKRNFDVNKPDETQLTLLHWAADRGNESMIRLLVKYGADLNVRDEDGQTPLFYAAHSSHIPCMKLLLELGADPSISDNDGELPSSVAQTDEERAIWNEHR